MWEMTNLALKQQAPKNESLKTNLEESFQEFNIGRSIGLINERHFGMVERKKKRGYPNHQQPKEADLNHFLSVQVPGYRLSKSLSN